MNKIRTRLDLAARLLSTVKKIAPSEEIHGSFAKADYVLNRSFDALDMAEHMKRELDSGRAQTRLLGMMSNALINGKTK
jgi:hypothetical protein